MRMGYPELPDMSTGVVGPDAMDLRTARALMEKTRKTIYGAVTSYGKCKHHGMQVPSLLGPTHHGVAVTGCEVGKGE